MSSAFESTTELPPPSADGRAHSHAVRAAIAAEIEAADSAISFERYMELALYAAGLGYYSAGAQKFGAAGDFITAPEIAPLFSRVLARQLEELLAACDGDTLLELGAGSGALVATALDELAARDALPARYLILEPAADLRARQRALLAHELTADVLERVTWLDALPEKPFTGIIFGNEVLDALPVARFIKTADGLCELGVGIEDDAFAWRELAPRPKLVQALAGIETERGESFPAGYRSEVNLNLGAFIGGLADKLKRGGLMFIDYGLPRSAYYLDERADGTFMCHYRHRALDDPFLYPGLEDITAHVDFTAVAEAGAACDLSVAGYTTQAHFLLGGGLDARLRDSNAGLTREHLELTRQVKMLTSPAEMGERFKAILLTRDIEKRPSGFALRDLAHQL